MLRAIEAAARDNEMPNEVTQNLELVWANYYVVRENYEAAIRTSNVEYWTAKTNS